MLPNAINSGSHPEHQINYKNTRKFHQIRSNKCKFLKIPQRLGLRPRPRLSSSHLLSVIHKYDVLPCEQVKCTQFSIQHRIYMKVSLNTFQEELYSENFLVTGAPPQTSFHPITCAFLKIAYGLPCKKMRICMSTAQRARTCLTTADFIYGMSTPPKFLAQIHPWFTLLMECTLCSQYLFFSYLIFLFYIPKKSNVSFPRHVIILSAVNFNFNIFVKYYCQITLSKF